MDLEQHRRLGKAHPCLVARVAAFGVVTIALSLQVYVITLQHAIACGLWGYAVEHPFRRCIILAISYLPR